MNKLDYIAESFRKIMHKRYESFCIQKIYHGLDFSIKPVVQQYVMRPDGTRALVDLYFPQFEIGIEVDEPYHLSQKEQDAMREMDIVSVTKMDIFRIEIPRNDSDSISKVNDRCEEIIGEILKRKEEKIRLGSFIPWNPEKEGDVQSFIDKGTLSVDDDAHFRIIKDCHRLFGKPLGSSNKSFKGAIRHMIETDTIVFPASFWNSKGWENSISLDGETFIEALGLKSKEKWEDVISARENNLSKGIEKYTIFLREKDTLGSYVFKFIGVFEIDFLESKSQRKVIYKRIATEVKTYSESEAKSILKARELSKPKKRRGRRPKMAA